MQKQMTGKGLEKERIGLECTKKKQRVKRSGKLIKKMEPDDYTQRKVKK